MIHSYWADPTMLPRGSPDRRIKRESISSLSGMLVAIRAA